MGVSSGPGQGAELWLLLTVCQPAFRGAAKERGGGAWAQDPEGFALFCFVR